MDLFSSLCIVLTAFCFPSACCGLPSLPLISVSRPNLIGQAHHGSGKTGAFSLGILSRVDLSKKYPQVIVLCPTRELAIQVADVLKTLAAYMPVDIIAAVPNQAFDRSAKGGGAKPPSEKITAQIIVGTPGTIDSKIAHRDLDTKGIIMFVADEADQMIAQEGLGDKTVQIKKRLPKSTQILLFSATFDDATKKFAKVVAPQAVEIMVKTEELSLDGIKQYFMGSCKQSRAAEEAVAAWCCRTPSLIAFSTLCSLSVRLPQRGGQVQSPHRHLRSASDRPEYHLRAHGRHREDSGQQDEGGWVHGFTAPWQGYAAAGTG